ncbi:hypothetical protein BTH38_29365 [Bacillus toyonensis]|uniref:YfbU family protein n=1 Tax=Bacillus toyonensis TaxID=155322 RepID=UPI000A19EA5A|nr:YfbU family protein [Bacillus toyonensis]OSM09687.1 hypothetical protein BTH38_29365 [Bacillus toyonensis]
MEISKTERLILMNQYLILEKLYTEDENRYKSLRIALEKGYTKNYHDVSSELNEELSKGECEFVNEVLKMYEALTRSYNRLQDNEGIDEKRLKFKGFDLNSEEAKYADYAHYCMHILRLYNDVKSDYESEAYDSHTRMTSKYENMLAVWESTGDKIYLNVQDIENIINA